MIHTTAKIAESIMEASSAKHCFDYEWTLVGEMFFIDQKITSYNM